MKLTLSLLCATLLSTTSALAEDAHYKVAESGDAQIQLVVSYADGIIFHRMDVTENFYISRAEFIPKGRYRSSSANRLSIEDYLIFENDPMRGKIQIGRLVLDGPQPAAEFCSGVFEEICNVRFYRGLGPAFVVELK